MKLLPLQIQLALAVSLFFGCSGGADRDAGGTKDPAAATSSGGHAGHVMTAAPAGTTSGDPHAGHTMSAAPAGTASGDPHAGHATTATLVDPKAHADHHGKHGGVLTMEGDHHVEAVVGPDGTIDIYVSDAARKPIAPGEVQGTITIDGAAGKGSQVLPLTADTTKGSLSAKGPAPDGSTTYTWDLETHKVKLKMSLAMPKGGTKSITSAAPHPKGH